jgi:hypothetical protein
MRSSFSAAAIATNFIKTVKWGETIWPYKRVDNHSGVSLVADGYQIWI